MLFAIVEHPSSYGGGATLTLYDTLPKGDNALTNSEVMHAFILNSIDIQALKT